MKKTKQHSGETGWIDERANRWIPENTVTVYVTAAQDLDTGGSKYAIVCDAHGTLWGARTKADARFMMHYPDMFCDACEKLWRKETLRRIAEGTRD